MNIECLPASFQRTRGPEKERKRVDIFLPSKPVGKLTLVAEVVFILPLIPVVVDLPDTLLLGEPIHLCHGVGHHDVKDLGQGKVLDTQKRSVT